MLSWPQSPPCRRRRPTRRASRRLILRSAAKSPRSADRWLVSATGHRRTACRRQGIPRMSLRAAKVAIAANIAKKAGVVDSTDWHRYPFELVPGDPQLSFPAAEGNHDDFESDTWFIAGELTSEGGRHFAFLTIFNKNRPGGTIVADFHTFALFDLDSGEYDTFTDYDMPPANMIQGAQPKLAAARGHLDLTYDSSAGRAVWRTCRDRHGLLIPYTYDVSLTGVDARGEAMRLELHVTPSRAPVPLGAAAYNGKVECFGQAATYSYFQTRMTMTGRLRWGAEIGRASCRE